MKQSSSGFSLTELIVAVAIVGVLTMIALPSYRKSAGRSRQAEAKAELAAIYGAEAIFHSELNFYSYCLFQLGYQPEGNNRAYFVGFHSLKPLGCGFPPDPAKCFIYKQNPVATCTCTAATPTAYSGGFRSDCAYTAVTGVNFSADISGYDWSVSTDTLTAGAGGNVNESGAPDVWTIDQQKTLLNVNPAW